MLVKKQQDRVYSRLATEERLTSTLNINGDRRGFITRAG